MVTTDFLRVVTEVVHARGHENVRSTHQTTFEATKEPVLTKRGDCIIAVAATKAALDLSPEFKEAARGRDAKITVTIECGGVREVVKAKGCPQLTFTHPTDMVVRKSGYVCGRTVAIWADKAAGCLSKELVEELRKPDQKVKITLTVERKVLSNL